MDARFGSEVISGRPVLVTRDAMLASDVRRLAAAAGTAVDVIESDEDALAQWAHAAVVLIGQDRVVPLSNHAPARRAGVQVVARGRVDHEVLRGALVLAAESVAELPGADELLIRSLTDARDGPRPTAPVVGVIGAVGGAGASVFAAALARVGAEVAPTLLVDADPQGAGADRMAGLEDLDGIRWDALTVSGRLGARALREALPFDDGLSTLAFAPVPVTAPPPEVVREVVSAARRGFGLVIVDLARQPVEPATDLVGQVDLLVIVSTLTLPALAAGGRLRRRLPPIPLALVTRGPDRGVDAESLARALGLTLAAVMPDQRGVDEAIALGLGPLRGRRGPLSRAAREVLASVDPVIEQ